MSVNRREFLKMAGLSAVMGITGASVIKGAWSAEASEPIMPPGALTAKHWAMVIDVRKINTQADYQKMIEACHSVHNVPDIGNAKDEVKWIWQDSFEHSFPTSGHHFMEEGIEHKPFLLLCNHCENPPCVRVCPTQATFKSRDGITQMDYHRCIGCRYCMAACPYGARSFNWKDPRPYVKKQDPEFPTRMIGVVEKCNFCTERLARGKKPACVEASGGALVFGDLQDPDSEVREVLRTHYTIVRKPELGTRPSVYYVIGG